MNMVSVNPSLTEHHLFSENIYRILICFGFEQLMAVAVLSYFQTLRMQL